MFVRSHRLIVAGLFLCFALLCAVAPLFAGTAYAHASLVRANPANNETLRDPPRIVLNFSEPLEKQAH